MLPRALRALSLAFVIIYAGAGFTATLENQRATFERAEQALKQGDKALFARLSNGLRDYPLYPYLRYQALVDELDSAKESEIRRFLDTYATTPLAYMLRTRWLDRLARAKRWSRYLEVYTPEDGKHSVSRTCHQLHALIATGKASQAMPRVRDVWLHGRSQPSACDPVFAAWTKAGHRTPEMIWQRIEKAMHKGEWRLADYLGRSLAGPERVWVKRWIRLYRKPERVREEQRLSTPHPYREKMLAHVVRRMAVWDGAQALDLWQEIKPRYPFKQAQIRRTEGYLVRNLVRVDDAAAYAFVRRAKIGSDDAAAHAARIRAALLREDWPQVVEWIAQLPGDERLEEEWQYWTARALEGGGDTAKARTLYARLAESRSYYGFLAADRIGVEYHLAHAETPVDDATMRSVSKSDAVRRARELFALERWIDGRREWRVATEGMSVDQLKAAAKLAEREGWHDRAIFTLARTGYWDDLELRFPLEHVDLVEQNARRHGIDIAWIFAVMRQESAFMHNVRSHAGAMGLMQLMPATARTVARTVLKRRPPRRSELFEPDTNIALGSAYLMQMKNKLGDSAVLATAAYNAGPHRVTRWLPQRTLPADIWIELVPFKETRGYLRRVLAYTVIYEKRMGRTPKRLRDRLHPVSPDVEMLGSSDSIASSGPTS